MRKFDEGDRVKCRYYDPGLATVVKYNEHGNVCVKFDDPGAEEEQWFEGGWDESSFKLVEKFYEPVVEEDWS